MIISGSYGDHRTDGELWYDEKECYNRENRILEGEYDRSGSNREETRTPAGLCDNNKNDKYHDDEHSDGIDDLTFSVIF